MAGDDDKGRLPDWEHDRMVAAQGDILAQHVPVTRHRLLRRGSAGVVCAHDGLPYPCYVRLTIVANLNASRRARGVARVPDALRMPVPIFWPPDEGPPAVRECRADGWWPLDDRPGAYERRYLTPHPGRPPQ